MNEEKFYCRIPATSANLGIGFDSIGLAVEKFLTIEAHVSDHWHVETVEEFLKVLPNNKSNLVVKTASRIASHYDVILPPLHIHMSSEIPLTHGLGSSSSAIVAGIELANYFGRLNLSMDDKIRLGSKIEGHPDNVGPCVTGGLFAGYYANDELFYQTSQFEGLTLVLSVPPYELSTKEARGILPKTFSHAEAVEQNAIANVMLMAMLKGDYETMGAMMMRDKLHEPYRQRLITEFPTVKALALEEGAYATVISGAGPTILTLCAEDKVGAILSRLQTEVPGCQHERVGIYRK